MKVNDKLVSNAIVLTLDDLLKCVYGLCHSVWISFSVFLFTGERWRIRGIRKRANLQLAWLLHSCRVFSACHLDCLWYVLLHVLYRSAQVPSEAD